MGIDPAPTSGDLFEAKEAAITWQAAADEAYEKALAAKLDLD